MTCRTAVGFVHHQLDFSQPTPMGFAMCTRCGGHFTIDQYVAWRCPGAPVEASVVPNRPGGVRCALCGEPIVVDPMHRATVEWFGGTCDKCFNLVEAIGADPTPTEVVA